MVDQRAAKGVLVNKVFRLKLQQESPQKGLCDVGTDALVRVRICVRVRITSRIGVSDSFRVSS